METKNLDATDAHGHQDHSAHDQQTGAQPAEADAGHGHQEHNMHATTHSTEHGSGHGAHVDHTGHEQMFRDRFWVSLALTVPVLLFSPMLQEWLGFSMPEFPGSQWVGPTFAIAIFFYGGVPFLQMAVPEVRNRRPGMMTLISLAISVAFVYSVFALFVNPGSGFFWEMATLIVVMLLGHWLEMRSVRQASGALNELARLMPDTAERILGNGETEEVPVSQLRTGDLVLVRPGASVPADGEVEEGQSDVSEAMITGESKPVPKEPGSQVIGGTINGDGSLRVRVTASG
jgi:Cu2+-exporting ATPase